MLLAIQVLKKQSFNCRERLKKNETKAVVNVSFHTRPQQTPTAQCYALFLRYSPREGGLVSETETPADFDPG